MVKLATKFKETHTKNGTIHSLTRRKLYVINLSFKNCKLDPSSFLVLGRTSFLVDLMRKDLIFSAAVKRWYVLSL